MGKKDKENKKNKSSRAPKVNTSTQEYLEIAEIRDDTVIMRNGSLRAVLLVSSINFALKSAEEQDAVVHGFMIFLNSLDFPIQISIQSRELNIDNYLEELKIREENQENELLRMQTAEYRRYVKDLVSLGEIMSKRFYVIIPFEPGQSSKKGFLTKIKEIFTPAATIRHNEKKFQEYRFALSRQVDQVMSGLLSFGVASTPLDTQGLIELYYKTYNPVVSKNQKLPNVGELRVEI